MLTDTQIRRAKAAEKDYRLTDGAGLHLFVTRAGGKHWRFRYELAGKEKLLAIGPYPAISLAEARQARDDAKELLRAGKDPSVAKLLKKAGAATIAGDSFETVAREWYGLHKSTWTPIHAGEVITSLERDVFPTIGVIPIRELGAPEVLKLMRTIEERGAKHTAHRIRQRMSAIFVFAIASGRGENDPAAIIKGAMAPLKRARQAAITDLDKARKIIADAEATPAHPLTKLALRLLALTAVRPGTLTGTTWAEFKALDPKEPTWIVPAARLKMRQHYKDDSSRDHIVPLPSQAIDVIETVKQLTGKGPLVFPNLRNSHKPMSENAIGYLLNRAGYFAQHVPHGWRSTFSTIMNERFPADRRVIDLMLAHTGDDKVEGAYNRAAHLARRRELIQIWADLIMEGLPPAAALLGMPAR